MRRLMRSAMVSTPAVWRWTLCSEGLAPLSIGAEASGHGCQDAMSTSNTGLQVAGPLRRDPRAPWVMAFSRPWHNPQSGQRGRIVAELPVERFQRVFGSAPRAPPRCVPRNWAWCTGTRCPSGPTT